MSNAWRSASFDRLSQRQLFRRRELRPLEPHHRHRGTGIWPRSDIVAGRRHIAGLSPSLPTAPPYTARTPARKAGVLGRGALLPLRDGLSAGAEWIRNFSSALPLVVSASPRYA